MVPIMRAAHRRAADGHGHRGVAIVDTQSTRRETVLTSNVISTLPVHAVWTLLASIPGVTQRLTRRVTDPS